MAAMAKPSTQTKSQLPTFADLEKTASVDPATLVAVFKDYATSGWAINGNVVIGIINRTNLSVAQLEEIASDAQTGVQHQTRLSTERDIDAYRRVGILANSKL